jgi:hypothetical protein
MTSEGEAAVLERRARTRIELVSLLTTFYLTVPILKPIYLELNKKAKDKLGLVITGPSGSGSVAGITQYGDPGKSPGLAREVIVKLQSLT